MNQTKEKKEEIEIPNSKLIEPAGSKDWWMLAFWAIAAVILCCLLFSAAQSGNTGDEILDGSNGKFSLAYYTEGDTTFADYSKDELLKPFTHLKYYGSGFEIVPAIMVKYIPHASFYEIEIRHCYCALWGFLLILFTGLTARLLGSWREGILAMLLMTLTPNVFGLSYFASKDIPFAAGFAIANYGFLRIFKGLPDFKIKDIITAMLGVAIAVSIRIGGLMLVLFFFVAFLLYVILQKDIRKTFFSKDYKFIRKSIGVGTLVLVGGSFLGLCFYPNFFHEGPISHIKSAMDLVSKFPQGINMLFEGEPINSLRLPPHYLLKSFLYTLPLFIFAGLLLWILNIKNILKKYDLRALIYLLFCLIFPLFYIIHGKAYIYNGWRHETFVYSNAIILAALGMHAPFEWFKSFKFNKIWQYLYSLIIAAMLLPTGIWMIKNYKYCYAYYNLFASQPYLNFDQDYYETAQTVAFKWLYEHELERTTDSLKICVRNQNVQYYAQCKGIGQFNLELCSVHDYASTECDYSIISTQFLPKSIIKTFFPPKGTIHVETIDGNPICAVVKRNNLDARGIDLVVKQKYQEALPLLDSAYQYDPNNFGLYFYMGYDYFQLEQYEKAIEYFKRVNNFWSDDLYKLAQCYIGVSLYYLNQYDEALKALKEALPKCPDKKEYITLHIALIHYKKGEYAQAYSYLGSVIQQYEFMRPILNECRAKM